MKEINAKNVKEKEEMEKEEDGWKENEGVLEIEYMLEEKGECKNCKIREKAKFKITGKKIESHYQEIKKIAIVNASIYETHINEEGNVVNEIKIKEEDFYFRDISKMLVDYYDLKNKIKESVESGESSEIFEKLDDYQHGDSLEINIDESGWYEGERKSTIYKIINYFVEVHFSKEKEKEDYYFGIYLKGKDVKKRRTHWGCRTKHSFNEIGKLMDNLIDYIKEKEDEEEIIELLEKNVLRSNLGTGYFYNGNYDDKNDYYEDEYNIYKKVNKEENIKK